MRGFVCSAVLLLLLLLLLSFGTKCDVLPYTWYVLYLVYLIPLFLEIRI